MHSASMGMSSPAYLFFPLQTQGILLFPPMQGSSGGYDDEAPRWPHNANNKVAALGTCSHSHIKN